jgi:transposase
MSAIRFNDELKEYYLRKVMEGKNKMLVLNNVRNKMIQRLCAVLTRQKPYVKNYSEICLV